jgi:DNA-binding protein
MNATELVAKLAETHGVSKAQAKSIVEDIMKNILDAAASGAEVSLPGRGGRTARSAYLTASEFGNAVGTGRVGHARLRCPAA